MMRAGRSLGNSLREAGRSLLRAKLRTMLGLVGIAVGIASVIAMISTGEIATAEARRQFEVLGTDIVTIEVKGAGKEKGIALEDALDMAAALPSVSTAAAVLRTGGGFVHGGRRVGDGALQGTVASLAGLVRLEVAEGRFLSDLDAGSFWCVVGGGVAAAIRKAGTLDVLSAEIETGGRICRVVGVLERHEEGYRTPFRLDADRSVFLPIATVERMAPAGRIGRMIARSAPGVHHEDAIRAVASWFRGRAPGLELRVTSAKQLIGQMEAQLGLMTLLLGAVGSIGLVLGGVGVMNVMLVSVSERRHEIGVRRAVGASRGDIRRQFLIEAILLTLAGGALGLGIGAAATWGICRYTQWEFFISTVSVAAGLGVSSAAGVFFGLQPAHRASRLDPVVALQGE